MPVLTNEQKRFIVQHLACFESVGEVKAAVKTEFGIDIIKQHVELYDPNKRAGVKLRADLRVLYHETRERFRTDTEGIPIANKSVRLSKLQRYIETAEERRNLVLAAQLIEQAAKESGDAYTNRHKIELTGQNGGPMRVAQETSDADLEAIVRAAGAAKAP